MMPAQQQLSLEPNGRQPLPGQDDQDKFAPGEPAPAPIWLQRMSLVVLVLFCFYIGGLLALLPWSPRYWDQNGWLLAHPAVETVLEHGWVRGIVSGVGLIDIWIGISELLHYRDHRR